MAVITPPSVTALPTPPSTASPSTFDALADAFLGALPTLQTETDALAANVAANATDAAASAVLANLEVGNAAAQAVAAAASAVSSAGSAVTAAAAAGAPIWVSGTTYTIGDVRFSPATQRVYRRKTAGAGTTDPSADATNWQTVDVAPLVQDVVGPAQAAVAFSHYLLKNVAATTVTMPASPSSGDIVWVTVCNGLTTNMVNFNGKDHQNVTWATDPTTQLDNPTGTWFFRFLDNKWRF